jgi:hypothetical protein
MSFTRRSLITAGATSAAAVAAGGLGLAAIARGDETCTLPTADELAIALSSTDVHVGDEVTASAAIAVVSPDGDLIGPQMKTVDIWWDLDPDQWWTALTGEPISASGGTALQLASFETTGSCSFSGQWQVPDVPPGEFGVMAIATDQAGECESYAPATVSVQ